MKIENGPLKGHTVEIAPQDRVVRFEAEIARILDALGYPDALVTDWSAVGDFWTVDDPDADAELAAASATLGVTLTYQDFIVDVAEKLRGVQ